MSPADGLRRAMRGLSEAGFRERFGTEEACRRALFEMRWPGGLTCPACGGRSFCELKGRKLFQCGRCKRHPAHSSPFGSGSKRRLLAFAKRRSRDMAKLA